jgi:Pyridoxamine 5'-phosphate oxidase
MLLQTLPSEVEAVFRLFLCCEFTTLNKQSMPITWPLSPLFLPETGRFLITTSIGLPQKAFNIRRNPHVSLLFSDPVGSGLVHPPTVLVQGVAEVPDEVVTLNEDMERFWSLLFQRQPASRAYSNNALTRSLMGWYYLRLQIYITPHRIRYWPEGDMQQPAQEIEVGHVG